MFSITENEPLGNERKSGTCVGKGRRAAALHLEEDQHLLQALLLAQFELLRENLYCVKNEYTRILRFLL